MVRAILIKTGCFLVLFGFANSMSGQSSEIEVDSLILPKVFLIGEYEGQYPLLYETYNDILLTVCHDDMNLAFGKWMDMITEMEALCQSDQF